MVHSATSVGQLDQQEDEDLEMEDGHAEAAPSAEEAGTGTAHAEPVAQEEVALVLYFGTPSLKASGDSVLPAAPDSTERASSSCVVGPMALFGLLPVFPSFG